MRRWLRYWHRIMTPRTRRPFRYRPRGEALEERRLLAAPVIDPITNQTVPIGKALYVPVTGSDADGDVLTYSVTSSNTQVTAEVKPGSTYLRLTVGGFGDMVFQLFRDTAPRTVDLISGFVKSKFYDGLTFHRIVRNFVIQGGDPQGDGTGGPGFEFDDEFHVDSIFTGNGQLAMANSGKDTNGSQFFVTLGTQRGLDHNHTIFGQLVRGFDVLTRISEVEVGANDRPINDVVITRASLFTNLTDAVLVVKGAPGAATATITVTADDGDGGTATQTFQVTSETDATDDPAILGGIANQITPANTPLTFSLSGTDPENDPLEFTATVLDSPARATVAVNGSQVTVTPDAGFTGPIRLRVGVKQQGATSRGTSSDPFDTQEIVVAVGDQPITPQSVTVSGTEGAELNTVTVATFTSGKNNAQPSDFTVRINWGDAEESDGVVTGNGGAFTVAGTHTYSFAGKYPIRITITSSLGFFVFTDTTATIADAVLKGEAAAQVRGRQTVPLTNVIVGFFTDANPNAETPHFTARIDWGDGEITDGAISAGADGRFVVRGTHTYATTGDRTVRVTITQITNTDEVTFTTATAETPVSIRDLPSNQRIVSQVYLDILERPADAAGLAFWTSRLDQGATRDEVLVEIQATLEYRQLVVRKLYRRFLNREPDQAGLDFLADALGNGTIIEQAQAFLVSSDEYFQNRGGLSNDIWLSMVFQDTLGRAIDAEAQAGFLQALNSGSTRREIVDVIFATTEHRQAVVRGYFQQLLRRITDPIGLDYFALVALASGARQEQVVAGICGADEYLDNVTVP